MPTKIQWTEEVWNPVTGCTKISKGCKNCYADAMCRRFWKQWDREPPPDHFKVQLHPDRLDQPLHWKKPRRVFVCSMGDLFHEDADEHFLLHVFETMDYTPHHIYQVLTKRPARMQGFVSGYGDFADLYPHVCLGISIENQACADERIPILLDTPAAVRFVSVEPMLGSMDMRGLGLRFFATHDAYLNWVIIGCESGPGRRPMKLEWAVDLVGQCKAAGVPCFVKQIEVKGKVSHDPAEWPEELRVREYPKEA